MLHAHLPGSVKTCVMFLSFRNLSLSLRSRRVSALSRCVSRTSPWRSSDCDDAPRASASLTAPRSRLALFSLDIVLARLARDSWLSSWAALIRGRPEYCSSFLPKHRKYTLHVPAPSRGAHNAASRVGQTWNSGPLTRSHLAQTQEPNGKWSVPTSSCSRLPGC